MIGVSKLHAHYLGCSSPDGTSQLFIFSDKYKEEKCKRIKGLFWLMVLEIVIHGHMTLVSETIYVGQVCGDPFKVDPQ